MMTRHGLMYWYFNNTNVLVNSNLYGTDTFANTNIICPSLRVACLVQSQIKENKKNGKYQLFHQKGIRSTKGQGQEGIDCSLRKLSVKKIQFRFPWGLKCFNNVHHRTHFINCSIAFKIKIITHVNQAFVHYASIFFEHFSEAEALSIIRAFQWHFPRKLIFPRK